MGVLKCFINLLIIVYTNINIHTYSSIMYMYIFIGYFCIITGLYIAIITYLYCNIIIYIGLPMDKISVFSIFFLITICIFIYIWIKYYIDKRLENQMNTIRNGGTHKGFIYSKYV